MSPKVTEVDIMCSVDVHERGFTNILRHDMKLEKSSKRDKSGLRQP